MLQRQRRLLADFQVRQVVVPDFFCRLTFEELKQGLNGKEPLLTAFVNAKGFFDLVNQAERDNPETLRVLNSPQLTSIKSVGVFMYPDGRGIHTRLVADVPAAFDIVVKTPDEYARRRSVE